jgi:hypothetical protein
MDDPMELYNLLAAFREFRSDTGFSPELALLASILLELRSIRETLQAAQGTAVA